MNSQLAEKLKSMIDGSSILNSYEKQEWLALLDLMNDKQILELERILGGPGQNVVKNIIIEPLVKKPLSSAIENNKAPAVNNQPVFQAAVSKAPHLGHIVNLPKIETSQEKKDEREFLAKYPKPAKENLPAKQGNFLQKLKNILREPELPSGHPEYELKLTDGHNDLYKKSPTSPLVLKKTPPIIPVSPKKILSDLNKTVGSFEKEPAMQSVSEIIEKHEILQKKSPGLENWPKHITANKISAPVKGGVPPARVSSVPLQEIKPVKVDFGRLKNLQDLALLSETVLYGENEEAFTRKLKDMIKVYGYHQVLQYLEKSPLYSSYIDTGKELLQKPETFEEAVKNNPDLLDREGFERLADILRVIQTE